MTDAALAAVLGFLTGAGLAVTVCAVVGGG